MERPQWILDYRDPETVWVTFHTGDAFELSKDDVLDLLAGFDQEDHGNDTIGLVE